MQAVAHLVLSEQLAVYGSEYSDICRDMSMYANIEGFLTYRCIYDVYRQALSEVSQWCCIVDASLPEVSRCCCIVDATLSEVSQWCCNDGAKYKPIYR